MHKRLVPLILQHIQQLTLSKENKQMTLTTLRNIEANLKEVICEAENTAHSLFKS